MAGLEIGRVFEAINARASSGRIDLAEELVYRQEVDRQRIHHPLSDRLYAVAIGPHDPEFLNISPNALVAGMEYVGSVHMRHHASLRVALRMTVAGHMRALVDHQNFVACLRERTTDNGAAKSSADDAIPHR